MANHTADARLQSTSGVLGNNLQNSHSTACGEYPDLPRLQASLVAQLVKNLPAMQETPVQFLGQKDPLEKG